LTKGSVVAIPIAISNMKDDSNVQWMQPVTEEEYNEVNK